MNVLNKVEIESTFRINAVSAFEAAKLLAEGFNRDTMVVKPVLGDEGAFLVVSTITSSTYYDVVFVELVSTGKYRVEVGSIRINEFEYLQIAGGEDAVNEIGFYLSERDNKVISTTEYNKEIAYWAANDTEKGTPGRMESHIKGEYKKVTMVNGVFE
jgi:hypothetical protein